MIMLFSFSLSLSLSLSPLSLSLPLSRPLSLSLPLSLSPSLPRCFPFLSVIIQFCQLCIISVHLSHIIAQSIQQNVFSFFILLKFISILPSFTLSMASSTLSFFPVIFILLSLFLFRFLRRRLLAAKIWSIALLYGWALSITKEWCFQEE